MIPDIRSETQKGMVNRDISKHLVSKQGYKNYNNKLRGGVIMRNQVRTTQ